MKEIKRYDTDDCFGLPIMSEDPEGEYVEYEDYKELLDKYEELQKENLENLEDRTFYEL